MHKPLRLINLRNLVLPLFKQIRLGKKAQAEVGKLAQEIRKTDAPSKTLQNNFRKAKNSARLAKNEFLTTKDATRQMGSALRKAGLDTKNLSSAQVKLGKNLATLRKRQSSLAGVRNAQNANMGKRSAYRSQMTDAVALGGALYGAIRPAVDFEKGSKFKLYSECESSYPVHDTVQKDFEQALRTTIIIIS